MHQRALGLSPKWNIGRMLAESMRRTPLEALPLLLASEDTMTRELASERLQECLDSMSAGELPKFLTDTDPVVRNAASDLLLRGPK